MSKKKNTETQASTTPSTEGLKIVGEPADTARFGKGDYVQAHLEMKGQVFLNYPCGERGVVIGLTHRDEEYYYHMPIVQFTNEVRMFNPDHLIVVQRADGSEGEVEKLADAEKKIAVEKAKAESAAEPA